ncbi:MAG: T9SS type A sorting domain-containing protein [Bacteroidales bacterium]|nr:T9SS type A sorting domain-containing protein [Bacteroidales bacterium]
MKKSFLTLFTLFFSISTLLAQLSQPSLSSPSNGGNLSSVNPSLSWSGGGYYYYTYNYDYQYDTVQTLNSAAMVKGSTTSTSISLSQLYFGRTYYWRIKSHYNGDDSPWSAVWKFTTPASPTPSSPVNGSTLTTEYTTLKWAAISGITSYEILMDTTPNFNSGLLQQNSTSNSSLSKSSLLYGTTYYWKVRANHSKDTSAWSAVQSFTTPSYVTLYSPTNGYSYTNNMNISFSWNSIANSTYYFFECDTTPNFNSTLKKTYNTSGTSYSTSDLHYNKTYYWRVRACNANDTSAWSSVFTFTTSVCPTLNSPSDQYVLTNSTCTTLYTNSISSSNGYIFQCDTTPNFNSPVSTTYSSYYTDYYITDLYYGKTHYWRVCAYNSNDTSEWSLARSFTTPTSPTLSSPADNSLLTQVQTTLKTNYISCANGYIFEIDTTANFSSAAKMIYSQASTSCSVYSLYYGKTHYWRVRAYNNIDTSDYSLTRSFITPAVPTLSSPANGSTLTSIKTTLYGNGITGSNGYIFEIDTNANFNTAAKMTYDTYSTSTSVPSLYYGKTHYWRMRAYNDNDTSAWSTVWTFNTPAGIMPTYPANGTAMSGVSITLQWTTITGTSYYYIEYDTSSNFNSPIHVIDSTTSSSRTFTFRYGSTYYWRVCAGNSVNKTPWSIAWNFTTPDTVLLSSPSDYYQNSSLSRSVSWYSISGSSNYEVQWDTASSFNSALFKNAITSSTSYSLGTFHYGKTYLWRVRAISSIDTSEWSIVRHIITPGTFTLSNPADSSVLTQSQVSASWKSISCNNYIYQYDTSATFNSPALRSGTTSNTYTTLYDLYYGKTHYWRVAAISSVDTSDWTAAWRFIAPDTVALSYPSDNEQIYGIDLTLGWNTYSGNTYYDYQYDTTTNFNSPLLYTSSTSGSSVSIYGLKFCTSYYWRVRARNNVDTSNWTTPRVFTTSCGTAQLFPADNDTLTYINPSLEWNYISGAYYYQIVCDTDSTFTSPLYDFTTSSTYYSISPLYYGTTYYWKMRVIAEDTTAWSTVWRFTTPIKVQLSTPVDSTYLTALSRTVYWTKINGSTGYIYQYDTVPTFNSTYKVEGTRSSSYNTASLTNFKYEKTIYWRVKAYNSIDSSDWSDTWRMYTPGPVILSSPVDSSTISGTSTSIYWKSLVSANYYDYQCDTTPNFDSPYLISGTVSSSYTYTSIYNLKYGATYYWRVRGYRSGDTTSWSKPWKFFTGNSLYLTNPIDSTLLTGISAYLQWSYLNGTNEYQIAIDTVSTFNSNAYAIYPSYYNYYTCTDLYYGQRHYWKVRAINATDTSAWSNEVWSFVTRDTVILSTPATNTILTKLSTSLYWKPITGSANYIYEYDITPNFNSSYYHTGTTYSTSTSINYLGYGKTYYWRVRAVSSVDTSSWSNIWTFDTPGTITPTSPADYTALTSLDNYIYWSTISGTSGYLYQYDTTVNYNSPALQEGDAYTNNYQYLNNLYYGATYYWRVRAYNSTDTSAWSVSWHFTTPNMITLTSPYNNSIISSNYTSLYWDGIYGSIEYEYSIDTTQSFNSPMLIDTTRTYEHVLVDELLFGTTYYWRVRAISSVDTSDWSTVWSFTTPAGITLTSPLDSTLLTATYTSITWQGINGASYYDYAVDTTPQMNSPFFTITTTSNTSYYFSALYYGTTYYWKVRARSLIDTTQWTPCWSFTTPGTVNLSSPANNTALSGLSSSFYWSTITGSNNYTIELDTTTNFNSSLFRTYTTSSSNYSFSSLYYGKTYYWRVRANNSVDTSDWSTVWSFTTPASVTLSTPYDSSAISSLSSYFYWNSISGSNNYTIELDTTNSFNSPAYQNKTTSYTNCQLSNFYYGTTYYWRVRANSSVDTSGWSTVWSFTTPGTVTLSSPYDNSVVSGLSSYFYWNSISGSNNYTIELDTTTNFNSPVYKTTTTSYTDCYFSNFYYGTTYYWRVRANNSVDTSNWSLIWSFTTPGNVTLSSPVNNTSISDLATYLYWNTISGSNNYTVEIDTSNNFTSPVYQTTTTSNDYSYFSNFHFGTTYYWRVRANNNVDTSNWSPVWSFSTPSAVTLDYPSDKASTCGTYQYVYWYYLDGATKYIVECDTTQNFNSPLYQSITTSYSDAEFYNILYGNTYYWRVKAYNSSDTSDWSPIWSFTNCTNLSTPTLISPVDMSINIPTNGQQLYWSSVYDASYYEVQYSTSSNFSTYNSFNTTSQTVTLNGLALSTTYYWRVRAGNYQGNSSWTSAWQFTTATDQHFGYTTINTCLNYTWHGTTYSQSGTYYDTISLAPGIDSIDVLTLIIHPSYNITISASACESYTWLGTTYTQSGNYTKTFSTFDGCDSILTLNLTIGAPTATISYDAPNNKLICSNINVSYQWVDCGNNYQPIAGATFSSFTPSHNGQYAVIITTMDNCSDTSDCMDVTLVSANENNSSSIVCHPNPTNGEVTIEGPSSNETLRVYDMVGKIITSQKVTESTVTIDLTTMPNGIYFIEIRNNSHKVVKKIVKE